ncbi:MAG: hypothetical protein HYR73_07130 [Candidatus Eisenbacteria bacterium]|nr:hypothetical protein [Candidatus Eisenbacteria bacterium]
MKFHANWLLAAALIVSGAAAPGARAQTLTPDRVLVALDATDTRIAQAEMLVATSADPRAQVELGAAHDVQARARTAFAASRLRISLDLTFEARGHADRAIAIVRGLPDPDRVRVQVERTADILDRVRQRIEECEEPRARGMLRAASTMQEHAELALSSGRYLAAIELSMGARERAFRSLRLCNLTDDLRAGVEQALRRTDDMLSRASEAVSGSASEAARQSLAQGLDFEARAQAEFKAQHFEPSLRLTQAARAMAHRAIRLSRG